MIAKLRHVGIVVSDLDAAVRFYCGMLGLKIHQQKHETGRYLESLTGLEGADATTIKLVAPDGNLVELLYFHSHPAVPRLNRQTSDVGISHIAFGVHNLELAYKSLSDAGVRFHAPPQISPDGYAKVAYCMDFDGNILELVEVLNRNV